MINVLAPEICKQIIEKFEINKDQQEETILKGHRSFKEIQLNKHEDWKPIVDGNFTLPLNQKSAHMQKK